MESEREGETMREKCSFCDGEGLFEDVDVEYRQVEGQDEPDEVQVQVQRLCRNCDGKGYIEYEEEKP